MKKISADYIFTGEGDLKKDLVIVADDLGRIVQIDPASAHDPSAVEKFPGLICPGFINTHCHLELSHMLGKVDTGTGLIPFIKNVVQHRDIPQEEILKAIADQDMAMYENGIVAVGDISNKSDTFETKANSPIRYYTFVEMFDFLFDGMTQTEYDKYKAVYDLLEQNEKDDFRAVPHAPYSVSENLFKKINELNPVAGTVSIHNQETPEENLLFLEKTGGFVDFYNGFNIPLEHFQSIGKRSIHHAIAHMDPEQKTLFVHNTTCVPEDLKAAMEWSENTYWVTNPNANLFIENRLPNYQYFRDAGCRLTIGTDSLTSNWQLSILEEIKTIRQFQSYVPLAELLRWATKNGAEALGFDDTLGTFDVGKKPGILNINLSDKGDLSIDSKVNRII